MLARFNSRSNFENTTPESNGRSLRKCRKNQNSKHGELNIISIFSFGAIDFMAFTSRLIPLGSFAK